jgi:hypothetical protein
MAALGEANFVLQIQLVIITPYRYQNSGLVIAPANFQQAEILFYYQVTNAVPVGFIAGFAPRMG